MEIAETQKRKKVLEDAIETLLNDFIVVTGLTIDNISFDTLIRPGASSLILLSVDACV